MRCINIILHFRNKGYADALARGLCYKYTSLNVFFEEDLKKGYTDLDRYILLTDDENHTGKKTIIFSDNDISEDCDSLSFFSPLDEILKSIRKLAFEEYGTVLKYDVTNSKVIGVYSKFGGIGVTSFSLMMARLISSKSEKRVLFLNLGPVDDYDIWIDHNFDGVLNKKQFLFMKEEGSKINIEDYMQEDIWGVYYFKPEIGGNTFFYKSEEVLGYIIEENYFSYIIVDFGKQASPCIDLCTESIELEHCNDDFIEMDDTSYLEDMNSMKLPMRGSFAQSVDSFIEKSELIY